MTSADDLARASASVHGVVRIPIKRHGEVPRMAHAARVPQPVRGPVARRALGMACWLLLAALAVGLVYRFGH